MIITSAYTNARKEDIYLIRYEINGEEGKILKRAKSKEEATSTAKLPAHWTLIECALAFVVKAQRLILASGAATLLIYSEDGRIPPSMLPADSQLGKALGERRKGNFICTIQEEELCVLTEIN